MRHSRWSRWQPVREQYNSTPQPCYTIPYHANHDILYQSLLPWWWSIYHHLNITILSRTEMPVCEYCSLNAATVYHSPVISLSAEVFLFYINDNKMILSRYVLHWSFPNIERYDIGSAVTSKLTAFGYSQPTAPRGHPCHHPQRIGNGRRIVFPDHLRKSIHRKRKSHGNYYQVADMIIMMENPKGISPSQRVTVDNLANLEMSCSRKSDDDG